MRTTVFLFWLGCEGPKPGESGGVDTGCAPWMPCGEEDSADTGSGDETGGEGEGEGETGDGRLAFEVIWDEEGVTLVITNGEGAYNWGMAQTDARAAEPWTGEDCYMGYVTEEGTLDLFCHGATAEGDRLTTVYSVAELELDTTLFTDEIAASETITYYVSSDTTPDCYVWGARPSYYGGLGCLESW